MTAGSSYYGCFMPGGDGSACNPRELRPWYPGSDSGPGFWPVPLLETPQPPASSFDGLQGEQIDSRHPGQRHTLSNLTAA